MTEEQPKKHMLLKVIISVVLVVVIAASVFFIAGYMQKAALRDAVKSAVVLQNKRVQAESNGDTYALIAPADAGSTEQVLVRMTVSGDRTTYCIEAESTNDSGIVYHMDQDSEEGSPLKGSCAETATVAPSTPGDVSLGSVGAGAVTLSWSGSPYAATYTMQCATNDAFSRDAKTVSSNDPSATLDELNGNSSYYCRVAAINAIDQSAWSHTIETVTNTVSLRPTDLVIEVVSTTALKYSWQAVEGATSYVLEYAEDSDFSTNAVIQNTQDTSGVVSGLKPYTAYFFHVKAVTDEFDAKRASFSDIGMNRTREP